MSETLKISVSLTSEQVSSIKEAVDDGRYATTSEVVREAMRDWQEKIKFHPEDLKRLRRLVDTRRANSRAKPLDWNQLRHTARKRLEKSKQKGRK